MARYTATGHDGHNTVGTYIDDDLDGMIAGVEECEATRQATRQARRRSFQRPGEWKVMRDDGVEIGVYHPVGGWTWWGTSREELRAKALTTGLSEPEWVNLLGEERWQSLVRAEYSECGWKIPGVLEAALRTGVLVFGPEVE